MIDAARHGSFPASDGGWRRLPPWRDGIEAVVAFTGHAVFCLRDDLTDDLLRTLGANGLGGAHQPRLIAEIAGPRGWIGSLDVLLVGRGGAVPSRHRAHATKPPSLVPRPDLSGHPRVAYAGRLRSELSVLGFDDGTRTAVVILGRGVAGLTELSYELEPERRGGGEGRALAAAALGERPEGEVVVACVAPGNAASLRSLLGAGFSPIGSIQHFRRPASTRQAPASDAGVSRASG
jgi:hypothetical protein